MNLQKLEKRKMRSSVRPAKLCTARETQQARERRTERERERGRGREAEGGRDSGEDRTYEKQEASKRQSHQVVHAALKIDGSKLVKEVGCRRRARCVCHRTVYSCIACQTNGRRFV